MIGKITIGKSFGGCIQYCLNDKIQEQSQEQIMKNRTEVLLFNKCYGNQKELVQQFNEVRQLNPKLSKPVLHITLSLAPGENLEKNKLIDVAEECAKDLGFSNNQFFAVLHRDTDHQHLHMVANRIGFDKRTVSDSNNYKKVAAFCRKMEQKYGLKQVLNPRRFLSKEMRQIPRLDTRKETMKNDVTQCILVAKNYAEFESLMKLKNYQLIKARGIAFIDKKGVYVKGSELGYSLAKIEKILQLTPQQKQTLFITSKQKELIHKPGINFNQKEAKSLSEEVSKNTKIGHSKILDDLLKPTHEDLKIPHELIKRRKKKRSQHL